MLVNRNLGKWWQWLGVLLILMILIGAVGLFYQLRTGSIWDGIRRLTIVAVTIEQGNTEAEKPSSTESEEGKGDTEIIGNTEVRILSIEPRIGGLGKQAATVVALPDEVKMRVARGYGDYMVSALYGLAVQEKEMNLLVDTLQNELGVAIEGYIVSNSKFEIRNPKNKEEEFNNLKNETLEWWRDRNTDSSLSWGDRWRWWWEMRKLRYDQIEWLDFSQGNWAREEQDVDGQSMIVFDKNTIDVRLPKLMADSKIEDEGLEMHIVNTTGINGLSKQIARVVGSMGGRVIAVTNAQLLVDNCQLLVNLEDRKSYTLKRLKEVFGCDVMEDNLNDSRVDIEMRVGKLEGEVWLGE